MKKIILIGAGGNGLVILDVLRAMKAGGEPLEILGVLDDDTSKVQLAEFRILGKISAGAQYLDDKTIYFVNGVGNNATRKMLTEKYSEYRYFTTVHPSAIIGSDVTLGEGVMVMPGAIINAGSRIGKGALINTGAVIEHENKIGEYVHIASGATTAGDVSVGDLTMLGTGTNVIQGIRIGRNAMIGAGSLVIRNIPDNCTAVGVPAKVIKRTGE